MLLWTRQSANDGSTGQAVIRSEGRGRAQWVGHGQRHEQPWRRLSEYSGQPDREVSKLRCQRLDQFVIRRSDFPGHRQTPTLPRHCPLHFDRSRPGARAVSERSGGQRPSAHRSKVSQFLRLPGPCLGQGRSARSGAPPSDQSARSPHALDSASHAATGDRGAVTRSRDFARPFAETGRSRGRLTRAQPRRAKRRLLQCARRESPRLESAPAGPAIRDAAGTRRSHR